MAYLFPPETTSLPIAGSDQSIPVHRIYCVGKNYADHAREMGGDPSREAPCFFSKPADAISHGRAVIPFPGRTANLHHEVELVVVLGSGGYQVSLDQANGLIFGYAVGFDLTRRDLQAAAKEAGLPWDVAKGFDYSAPVSAVHPVSRTGYLESAAISLAVNGQMRQQGNIADMTWKVPEILVELSTYFELRPGDCIFTGTPAGVGRLVPGDKLHGVIENLDELTVQVGSRDNA